MDDKYIIFEYILLKCIEWYEEENINENDLSILKSLQLLFFITTFNNEKLNIINKYFKYYAQPFGSIEKEIFKYIKFKQGNLEYFIIDNYKTQIKNNYFNFKDFYIKNIIDSNLLELKIKNKNFIRKGVYELMDINRQWYCWKYYYANNIREEIDISYIKNTDKIYDSIKFYIY